VDTGGPWNLYVLYDPNYVPDSFFLGVKGAAAAKPKSTNVYQSVAEAQRAMRLPKRTAATSLEKPSSSTARKEEPDEREASGARLIIGAASRVENLLPTGTSQLIAPEGLRQAYVQWLSKDVAYIITPEEARAFKMLKTDEQRELFIEQFWQRRDSNTSTEENEYRREHYARIAHANENFSFKDVPGWKTDRGRIYIMYGKPDEVEQFPSGERWLYKNIQKPDESRQLEFVDSKSDGDYRLQKEKQ
jgi:GWxTD domain-containing protein